MVNIIRRSGWVQGYHSRTEPRLRTAVPTIGLDGVFVSFKLTGLLQNESK